MKDKIIDSLIIQQYLEGKLDPREMHELEKQSLEDKFLADALEGYSYVIEPAQKLSILQQRLADRIVAQEAEKKAFSISANRLSIAAAAGLMCVLAAILFWMNGYKTQQVSKKVEVSLAAPSSTANVPNTSENIKTAEAITKTAALPILALADQSLSRSEPIIGWDEYSMYIQSKISEGNNQLQQNLQNLVITFRIGPTGTPVDLKVITGVSDDYAAEVIRVIQNGPLWKPVDSEEVRLEMSFNK